MSRFKLSLPAKCTENKADFLHETKALLLANRRKILYNENMLVRSISYRILSVSIF